MYPIVKILLNYQNWHLLTDHIPSEIFFHILYRDVHKHDVVSIFIKPHPNCKEITVQKLLLSIPYCWTIRAVTYQIGKNTSFTNISDEIGINDGNHLEYISFCNLNAL